MQEGALNAKIINRAGVPAERPWKNAPGNVAEAKCFLGAGNAQALPLFQDLHEMARFINVSPPARMMPFIVPHNLP